MSGYARQPNFRFAGIARALNTVKLWLRFFKKLKEQFRERMISVIRTNYIGPQNHRLRYSAESPDGTSARVRSLSAAILLNVLTEADLLPLS